MADYVLVHGAWGGGHSYGEVPDRLRAAGHRAIVTGLRGLGVRQAELHPGIVLSDHVTDVCEQIEQVGFDRFVLVGHSYGGMVITGVAARLGGRIDALCYIDAFVPTDGQSLWEIATAETQKKFMASQKFTPGLVAPLGALEFEAVPGIRGRQPLLTLTEGVRFTGEEARVPRRAYIYATNDQPTTFTQFSQALKGDPAWEYHESAASHQVMAEQPEQVTEVLLGLSR